MNTLPLVTEQYFLNAWVFVNTGLHEIKFVLAFLEIVWK